MNKRKKGETASTLQGLGRVLTERLAKLQSAEARFEAAKDAYSRALAEVQADAQVKDAAKITLSIERMRKEIDRKHIRPAPYGFRIDDGRAAKHPDEMPALRRILGMRLKGVSLRGIAQWLDEQGVPTRRRGKGWHSQVVKLIADRMIGKRAAVGRRPSAYVFRFAGRPAGRGLIVADSQLTVPVLSSPLTTEPLTEYESLVRIIAWRGNRLVGCPKYQDRFGGRKP